MLSGIEGLIVQYLLSLVIDELHTQEGKINWVQFEAGIDAKIKQVIPTVFLEAQVMAMAHSVIAALQGLSASGALDQVLSDVAAGKFAQALSDLEKAIQQAVVGVLFPAVTLAK